MSRYAYSGLCLVLSLTLLFALAGCPEPSGEGEAAEGEAAVEAEATEEGDAAAEAEGAEDGEAAAEAEAEGDGETAAEAEAEGDGEAAAEAEAGEEGEAALVEGEAGKGRILGWVKDTEGVPIPGVAVSAKVGGDTFNGSTSAEGLFGIQGVTPASGVLVVYGCDGYTTNSQYVDVLADEATSANAVLKVLDEPTTLADAAAGGTADDTSGQNAITFAADSIVDEDGDPVTGAVDVYVTPLDVSDEEELNAFPGDFRGVTAGKSEEVILETFGLADFTITQTNAKGEKRYLKLAGDTTAEIEIRIPDSTKKEVTEGDTIGLWYFNEETGMWEEEGTGEVGVASDGSGELAFFADVSHLSWWNADDPIEIHCLTGRVLDENGSPVAGAQVKAYGQDYSGVTTDTTDENGEFCILVKVGSNIILSVFMPGADTPSSSQAVTVPNSPAGCGSGNCTDLGDISASFDSCIHGHVIGEDGVALSGVEVYSSFGGRATTDSDGYYIMGAPGGVTVSVFVLGRPSVSVETPVTAIPPDGCAEADIEVDYPDPGDHVGYITGTVTDTLDFQSVKAGKQLTGSTLSASANFFADGGLEADVDFGNFGAADEDCEFFLITEDTDMEEVDPFGTTNNGALDPGSPGAVTNGTDTLDLYRQSELYEEAVEPWMMGAFTQDDMQDASGFDYGDDLTFTWPGGIDIDSFSVDTTVPPAIVLLSPELGDGLYGMQTVDLDTTTDLTLQWELSGGAQSLVVISIITSAPESPGSDVYVSGLLVCYVVDDGEYTIDAATLSQMPRGEEEMVVLSMSRLWAQQVNVPLTRGGNGVVTVSGGSSLSAFGSTLFGEGELPFEAEFGLEGELPINFSHFPLTGTQVVGSTGSDEVGCGTVTVITGEESVLNVTVQHTVADPSQAFLYRGAAGQNGTQVLELVVPALGGIPIGGILTNPPQQVVDDLAAGNLYVEVESDTNPDGAIRGQAVGIQCDLMN